MSNAAAKQLEEHRTALTGHCYRMLGSICDAEDAVQETMVRAWKGFDGFDGRAALRTWLYRIATNVCLDALSSRNRRARPIEEGPVGTPRDELTQKPRTHWLEPVPDALAVPSDCNPAEAALMRQSIRLAFVAALQHLAPKQRAVLLLSEVLGWSSKEVADSLELSTAAVNSALQRARSTLSDRKVSLAPQPLTPEQTKLLDRYVDAFQRYDVDALAALMKEDATLSMPPFDLWLRGAADIKAFMLSIGAGCRGSVLVPTMACGIPAFGQYRDGGKTPWALMVPELDGESIVAINNYLDTANLFHRFGLPPSV